jgi:hypothetical protein
MPATPLTLSGLLHVPEARLSSPSMPKSVLTLLGVLAAAAPLSSQSAPPDTVQAIAALHSTLVDIGARIGPRIWPGFRPDTIPTLYVIPHRAKLFAQWRDTLPTGFFPLPRARGAAWTDTRTVAFPRGRPIAFLSVDSTASAASVLGLALHEQFHAFQQAAARRGRRFGAGENSMLVATYPAFDVTNEAAFALEGEILGRALRARTRNEAKQLARRFLAVREGRHARLDSAIVGFETAAELNEGLAQYAMLRGLRELAREDARRFETAAITEVAIETVLLDSLLAVGPRSTRRRFYATGSAIARLLDRLADPGWKSRLVGDDATLHQVLAAASDYRGRDALGRRSAELIEARRAVLTTAAERAVAALDARRRAQRDSVLAQPGLRLVVDASALAARPLNWCFFDPQNVLSMASGELLHTRMLRLCSGQVDVQLDQAAVEDRRTGVVQTVVGDANALKVTAGGAPISLPPEGGSLEVSNLRIEGPTFKVVAPRATVARHGNELRVVLRG